MPKVKHTYKPEMIDGRKVTFKYKTGIVWAYVPGFSKECLGTGNTKAEAITSLKKTIKHFKKSGSHSLRLNIV